MAAVAAVLGFAGCRHPSRPTSSPSSNSTDISNTPAAARGIHFTDIAQAAGITYRYPQIKRPSRNADAFGRGCAAFDFDGDGWMDILLVASPHPILYHNRGNGTFEDVSARCGLGGLHGDWTGCAIGDYDGDGRLDILLTGYRCLALLRNVDGHRFEDVTARAGLDPHNHNHWGSSAGFMDLDGSGRMALVLLNYVVFGPNEPQFCELSPGITTGCPPSRYKPEYPELWENIGNGRFRDITSSSGLRDRAGAYTVHGKSLVVAFADYDNDGKMDFYIGNDGTPAELMHNEGGLHFRNMSDVLGVALGVDAQAQASMGADWADYDRDGKLDLVNTAFSKEAYSLYRNNGYYFDNVSTRVGLADVTRKQLGFGAKFIDANNDGYPCIVFADGHVYDQVGHVEPNQTFHQPTLLFYNDKGTSFKSIGATAGEAFSRPILGRGLATADFDNDGKMDILVVDFEGSPLLLHNDSNPVGHWVELRLHGAPPNYFAYGAQVTLRAGTAKWISDVSPASSYLSSSSPVVHFGLGTTASLDSIQVRWSDHRLETFQCDAVDHIIDIKEGGGKDNSSIKPQ